jgi:hypothetical protein
MRLAIANGNLNMLAETPREGFELAEMVAEADLVGKHVETITTSDGDVGVIIPLLDRLLVESLIGKETK